MSNIWQTEGLASRAWDAADAHPVQVAGELGASWKKVSAQAAKMYPALSQLVTVSTQLPLMSNRNGQDGFFLWCFYCRWGQEWAAWRGHEDLQPICCCCRYSKPATPH